MKKFLVLLVLTLALAWADDHVEVESEESGEEDMLGAIGPAWTYDESMEAPAGQFEHEGAMMSVYTPEQQRRLGVDVFGKEVATAAAAAPIRHTGVSGAHVGAHSRGRAGARGFLGHTPIRHPFTGHSFGHSTVHSPAVHSAVPRFSGLGHRFSHGTRTSSHARAHVPRRTGLFGATQATHTVTDPGKPAPFSYTIPYRRG